MRLIAPSTSSVTKTLSSHSYSRANCGLSRSEDTTGTVPLGGVGFLDLNEAGGFVKESGSSGTDFILSGPNCILRCSSPWLSLGGCWNTEMLVP